MGFEIQKRDVAYQGRAFDVQRLTVSLPDGTVRVYDLVQHNPSITVIPVTNEGQILFVRQYRMGAEETLLELPAGVLDEGEDPMEGARRELREETGMDAGELKLLGKAYLAPGYSSELMYFYLGRQLSPAPLEQDEDEFLHLESLTIEDSLGMARRGEFLDSKTLAAMFLAGKDLTGRD